VNARRFSFSKIIFALVIFSAAPQLFAKESELTAGQKERAVSALQQAVKDDPSNAELWLHLGFAYRKAAQIDDAQHAFEKSVSLNAGEADAYYMLGLIYESKHQTQEAEKAWKSYLAAETDASKRAVAEKHIHHLNQ